jgi:proteasome-associated ATPase
MANQPKEFLLMSKILKANESLDYEEEKEIIQKMLAANPKGGPELIRYYFERYWEENARLKKAEGELKALEESPWFPSRCISVFDTVDPPMALVSSDSGRRALVSIGENVKSKELMPGTPVLLNQKMNMVVRVWQGLPLNGEIGSYSRSDRGRIIVKAGSDTEVMLHLCEDLKNQDLQPGDAILFDQNSRLALQKIAKKDGQEYFIEDTPEVSFADIGGLDAYIQELVDYIDLHFFHSEIVEAHRLRPAKGILLCGKPGVGKTMLAKAVANYCSGKNGTGPAKFMNIPAGSQRHWLYGATEHRYRQIFTAARQAAKENGGTRVVMFWDELDNTGHRTQDFGADIDSRTLTTFLSELDGLEKTDNILVIGATNREDLIDPALKRPQRFGDRIFRLPRPDRQAAADIFGKYLKSDLPFYSNGMNVNGMNVNGMNVNGMNVNGMNVNGRNANGDEMAEEIIEAAVAYLYAPNRSRQAIARMTFRDGSKREVAPEDVISGALIENTVRKAAYASCIRSLEGQGGITTDDVLAAVDEELDSIALQLKSGRTVREWLDLDQDADVVKVEALPAQAANRMYQYVRN